MPNNDPILLKDVRLIFRNFSGREGDFNPPGSRNFAVLLTPEMASGLGADGYNVKTTKERELDEGEITGGEPYLPVALRFDVMPPQVWMVNSRGRTRIGEDLIDILDDAVITHVDMYIRPYDYKLRSGVEGRKAYLKTLYVTVEENELDEIYADVPIAGSKTSHVEVHNHST
jgi:hypothetical protein